MDTQPTRYHRRLAIVGAQVSGDLQDFPVLVHVSDPALRTIANGGHVAREDGSDIFFALPGQQSRLGHALAAYDPRRGELKAWVRVPQVSGETDTPVELWCGESVEPSAAQPPVWDADYRLVPQAGFSSDEQPALDPALRRAVTVEAWVHTDASQPEALQPLVSQWAPPDEYGAFAGYDAGQTDGLKSIAYFGAVFDGRYVYFSPQHYKDHTAHGIVLRYDTHSDFHDPASYAAFDAGNTAGLKTRGYYGALFDGRYVYFVPRQDEAGYHSRVLRYDTHRDFKRAESWDAYDVGEAHSQQGVAFDGRFIYFSPGFHGDSRKETEYSARVIRYDTQAAFKDPSSWRVFDAANVPGPQIGCFDGAGFDGRYIYFAPLIYPTALRYDTRGDFADPSSWQGYDAGSLGMAYCVGVVFDGAFIYFVPYQNDRVVRYNTRGDFMDPASWSAQPIGGTGGLNTGGFDGGFFDGRYVYFVPFVSRGEGGRPYIVHTNFLRYDTSGRFDDPASWSAHDASLTDGIKTVGYNGGAFDGRFFYLAPWQDATPPEPMHGRVLRYDTLGPNGVFSLRYCDYGHNGGLCAAVPGPSFLVNTERGVLSVAAHRALPPGWHHLAGVYDGRRIKLFVDGVLAAERNGGGALVTAEVPVTIGRLPRGVARFAGTIADVRLSAVARSDDWIKTSFRNLSRPASFVRLEAAEQG
jgi:hypothetical protein